MKTIDPPKDIFAEARDSISIADAWRMLGYEGEPKRACKSPFREDIDEFIESCGDDPAQLVMNQKENIHSHDKHPPR